MLNDLQSSGKIPQIFVVNNLVPYLRVIIIIIVRSSQAVGNAPKRPVTNHHGLHMYLLGRATPLIRESSRAHITKNPNFHPILTSSNFHKKVRIDPNFSGNERKLR